MKAKEIDNPVIGEGMAKWRGEKLMSLQKKEAILWHLRRKEEAKKKERTKCVCSAAAQIMVTCGFR